MEHIIHLLKEMLSNLGANLQPQAALRCSQAVKPVEDQLCAIDSENHIRRPSGRHTVAHSQADFQAVKELHLIAEVFKEDIEGSREHLHFPKFERSPLTKLDYSKLNEWINHHKKLWSKKVSEKLIQHCEN